MALIGQDFGKFPMGSGWTQAEQDERDKFIRLSITRLEHYGITDERSYSEAELGAIAAYVRALYDRDGVGDIEPPEFVTRALEVSVERPPPPIAFAGGAVLPNAPLQGSFVLFSRNGKLTWVPFPDPGV